MENRIRVLDCTLRDGGYCNQWQFGFENTKTIINELINANIDIIECGFLTNKIEYVEGSTKFTTLDKVERVLPVNRSNKIFVCLMNYGEYRLEDIPEYNAKSVDGFRIAFHKEDMLEALKFCKGIKKKGYKVFVQAMVSLNYSNYEFLNLIEQVNEVNPYAFYIVDSFGVMKRKDLIRLFYIVENNLHDNIYIGYHSHNNMQLAYANAQALVDIQTKRNLIIDSSVFGMGRGAGNLNTELWVEYLNDICDTSYSLYPLLKIIDRILNKFYQENYWGYSLPNYLSASHNAHPNYASYLSDKQTLTVEDINAIFDMMSNQKKMAYDQNYIERLYIQYLAIGKSNEEHLAELKSYLLNKKVLIIAPGKSSKNEKGKIILYSRKKDVVTISINHNYPFTDVDFIFLSNLRRYREINDSLYSKCIVTSNIPIEDTYLQIKYIDLLNDIEAVKDNSGMMLIKFLISIGVKDIIIAGMDGYSHEMKENYFDKNLELVSRTIFLDAMNKGMGKLLKRFSKQASISFLTKPKYIILEE